MRVHMEHSLIEDHRCWLADNEANLLEISLLRKFSIDRSISSYGRSLGATRTSPISRHIDVLLSRFDHLPISCSRCSCEFEDELDPSLMRHFLTRTE